MTIGHQVNWFAPDRPVNGGTVYRKPQTSCVESASCEDGDHTFSWPCDLASTDEET